MFKVCTLFGIFASLLIGSSLTLGAPTGAKVAKLPHLTTPTSGEAVLQTPRVFGASNESEKYENTPFNDQTNNDNDDDDDNDGLNYNEHALSASEHIPVPVQVPALAPVPVYASLRAPQALESSESNLKFLAPQANNVIQRSASDLSASDGQRADLRASASHGYGHHNYVHSAKGWLDMGAWTGGKGSFGWYADYPVGKSHHYGK